jgi:hypothetical protein
MKNDWEKKATCPTIIKHFLEFAPSNGNGPTDHLHIFCIGSIWKILHFYSSLSLNPSKSDFFHALTVSLLPKNHMLFIVSKQCACSRRVHIEGHMNRFEYCHPDNNSDNDSFGSFLSKKSYLLQHNSVLIFILWRSVRKSTIILGMKKITQLVDNIPLRE